MDTIIGHGNTRNNTEILTNIPSPSGRGPGRGNKSEFFIIDFFRVLPWLLNSFETNEMNKI
jgi:hypothetical protein